MTNALISYFQNVLLIALTADEVTINGAGGGTLAIAGNEWVLTDYSSDGLLVLNGTLNVGEDQFPHIPITGNIVASGASDATVSLDLVVDVSGDEPSLSGTVTVGVPYDIGDIIAAAEDGGMDGDGDADGDMDGDGETDGDMDGDGDADGDGDGETDGDADGDGDGDMDGDADGDGDTDGDGETDGDDLPEGPITSARTLSDDPAAGSAELRHSSTIHRADRKPRHRPRARRVGRPARRERPYSSTAGPIAARASRHSPKTAIPPS